MFVKSIQGVQISQDVVSFAGVNQKEIGTSAGGRGGTAALLAELSSAVAVPAEVRDPEAEQ